MGSTLQGDLQDSRMDCLLLRVLEDATKSASDLLNNIEAVT